MRAKSSTGAIDIYVQFVAEEPGFKALWIDGLQTSVFASVARRVPDSAIPMARAYAVTTLGFPETPELDLRLAIARDRRDPDPAVRSFRKTAIPRTKSSPN